MDALRSGLARILPPKSSPLNQANESWGRQAGRSAGPENYVSGDLVRSVFDRGRRMSPLERIEHFGNAVLLVGVIDVDLSSGSSSDSNSLFCSVVPLNAAGVPIEREKKLTKAAALKHAYASFDEVFAFGRLCDLDSIHSLKIKGKIANAFA